VLKMKLDSLTSMARRNHESGGNDLAECAQLAEESIKEVRTISYLLHPPMLDELGLESAIPWYLEGFAKRSGIKTALEMSPGFGRLSSDIEIALFRVLQESLTNVHRHSGSPTAKVRLLIDGEVVTLEVSDEGKGMQLKAVEAPGRDWVGALGVGLRGMNERIRQLGGRLDLRSSQAGTTVQASVPLDLATCHEDRRAEGSVAIDSLTMAVELGRTNDRAMSATDS
jgi:signal transduction histidine kinase